LFDVFRLMTEIPAYTLLWRYSGAENLGGALATAAGWAILLNYLFNTGW
jgi:hypothetical protein